MKQGTKKHPESFLWMFFYDNCSPYFFNVSPTVHCRIQNEWAQYLLFVFRLCSRKKHPSQYVSNKSFTSVMSCFLSTFAPLYSVISL